MTVIKILYSIFMKLREILIIKIGENLRGEGILKRNLRKIIFSLMHGIKGFEFSYFSDRNGEHELLDKELRQESPDSKYIVFDALKFKQLRFVR